MIRLFRYDGPPSRLRLALVVGVAVVALGTSAPIVRGMDAGPLAIAAWRTLAAALLLAPAAWSAAPPTGRERLALLGAGLCLGAHFALWFAALGLTTVLRATVLVCLAPLWAGALEWALDRVPPPPAFWLGAVVAVGGTALLTRDGGAADPLGDALALVAGLLWPLYLHLTRGYRNRTSSFAAMGRVCAVSAAATGVAALAFGDPLFGWSGETWALLALAVAAPQLVGHQGLAWAVRWIPASRLAAATLLEPVIAGVFALFLFGERPGPTSVIGAAVVLVGVWICVRAEPMVERAAAEV